jgi:phosphate-selective porin OprO/OprP
MKTKLKQLTVAAAAAVAGAQFTLPAVAADTNTTAQAEVPAYTANGSGGNPAEEAEIKALKQEVDALVQKVNTLEQQQQPHAPEQQTAQVQELDQKVRILERQREIDQDNAAELAKSQPKISLGQNGFSIGSADSNFVAALHATIQLDSRTFIQNHGAATGDGFLLRRARPIISGTVFHDFDFYFLPEFGGSTVQILDVYANYHYNQALQLEAGKFKSPVGLEQLQQDQNINFNERTLANNLVANRDLGIQLHGDVGGGTFSYAAAVLDGAPDYISTTVNSGANDEKAFAGRLFLQPFKSTKVYPLQGLGLGLGGSYESDRDGASGLTAGYMTDGQQKFFSYTAGVVANGTHWRLSPQGYYYYGPFGLLGEYMISDQAVSGGTVTKKTPEDLQNTAWEVTGGWVLTGEDASYNGIAPLHPFNLHTGGWGAWQVVARYAELNVDNAAFTDGFVTKGSASGAQAWSAGLNWYLNKNVRFDLSYSHTTFSLYKDQTTAVTAHPENVIFTRIQLGF